MGLSMILEEIRNIQPLKKTPRPPMKRATKNTNVRNGLLLEKKQTPSLQVLQLLATTKMCGQNEVADEDCVTRASEPLAKLPNCMGVSLFSGTRVKTLKRALSDSADDKPCDVVASSLKCNEDDIVLSLHRKANSNLINKNSADSIKISSSDITGEKGFLKEVYKDVDGVCVSHARKLLNKLKHLHKKKVSHNLQHYQTCLQHLLNKANTMHPCTKHQQSHERLMNLLRHKIPSIRHKTHEIISTSDLADTDISSEDETLDDDVVNNLNKQLWLVKHSCSNGEKTSDEGGKRLLVCVDASKWVVCKKMLAQYLHDHPPNDCNHSTFDGAMMKDVAEKYDTMLNNGAEDATKHVSLHNNDTPFNITTSSPKYLRSSVSHLHPHTPHLHLHTPHLHPHTPRLHPHTPHLHPSTPHLHPHTPHLHPHILHLHPSTPRYTQMKKQVDPIREFFWKNQQQLQEVFSSQTSNHKYKRTNNHNGCVRHDDVSTYDEEEEEEEEDVMGDDDDDGGLYIPAQATENKRHSGTSSQTLRHKQAGMHRRVRSQNFDINDVYLPCDKIIFKPTTLSSKQIDVPEWTIDLLYDELLNNTTIFHNNHNNPISFNGTESNEKHHIDEEEEVEDICDSIFMQRHLTQEIFEKKSRMPNYKRHNKLHGFVDNKYGDKMAKKSAGKTFVNCNSSCTGTCTTVAPQPITSHDSMPYKHSSTISASSDALESSCQSHDMYDTPLEGKGCQGHLGVTT